jgi:hypothetical protein
MDTRMTNTVTDFETILRILLVKQDALLLRGAKLDEDERRRLAFEAHTTGGDALEQLDRINREAATFASEFAGIKAAIGEAEIRLAAARRDEAAAADRAQAIELRSVVQEFAEHGKALHEALEAVVDRSAALVETQAKMLSLGCARPARDQISANVSRAVGAALMRTPWHRDLGGRFLAPGERRTLEALMLGGPNAGTGWLAVIEADIRRRLGEMENAA